MIMVVDAVVKPVPVTVIRAEGSLGYIPSGVKEIASETTGTHTHTHARTKSQDEDQHSQHSVLDSIQKKTNELVMVKACE